METNTVGMDDEGFPTLLTQNFFVILTARLQQRGECLKGEMEPLFRVSARESDYANYKDQICHCNHIWEIHFKNQRNAVFTNPIFRLCKLQKFDLPLQPHHSEHWKLMPRDPRLAKAFPGKGIPALSPCSPEVTNNSMPHKSWFFWLEDLAQKGLKPNYSTDEG